VQVSEEMGDWHGMMHCCAEALCMCSERVGTTYFALRC
jgi:hypothetical protein